MADRPPVRVATTAGPAGLVLGTPQLAAPYGSAAQVSPPAIDEGMLLVRKAIELGVIAIDTARAYPGSEEVLGSALVGERFTRCKLVTKLSPLAELGAEATAEDAARAAEASVIQSLETLKWPAPWVLLHRAEHLTGWDGAIWDHLKLLKRKGLLSGLGVSVQSPKEALTAVENPDVQIIQLPFNLLDWRWRQAGLPEALAQRPELEVHARSVYLQGILLRDPVEWPRISGVDADAVHRTLQKLSSDLGRSGVADLCVAFVRAMPWLAGVIIGMESVAQLDANLALFENQPLTEEEIRTVDNAFPVVPENLLNPSKWPPISSGTGERPS